MVNLNTKYLKGYPGCLKLSQLILLTIAFSCITGCCEGGKNFQFWFLAMPIDLSSYFRNVSFFLAVTALGWILVVVFLILFLFNLHKKCSHVNWEMLVMITSFVWSGLLLLCCSLLMTTYQTGTKGKSRVSPISSALLSYTAFKSWLNTMIAGLAFGFLALMSFLVDAAFLFKRFWSKRKTDNHNSPGDNPAVTKLSEVPGQATPQNQPQIPPGQTLEAAQGQTVTNLPGQTVQNSPGQAMFMHPLGQQVQNTTGQPVEMLQVA